MARMGKIKRGLSKRRTAKRTSITKSKIKGYVLPSPDAPYGHTQEQVERICKDLGIDLDLFWTAWGVNTVAIDDLGRTNYYTCDIEKALWKLKQPGGKFHLWD